MTDDQPYDIRKVLEHYGWQLPTRTGGWISVKCGEHGDTHASARVNFELGAVKCMACEFGGDVIKIIREKEGCTYAEAVAIAEEVSGYSVPAVCRPGRDSGPVSRGSRDLGRGGDQLPSRLRGRSATR